MTDTAHPGKPVNQKSLQAPTHTHRWQRQYQGDPGHSYRGRGAWGASFNDFTDDFATLFLFGGRTPER